MTTAVTPRIRNSINKGIYDSREIALLIREPESRVERWIMQGRVFVPAGVSDYLTFLDLISLRAVSELRRRGVAEKDIETGRKYLVEQLGTPWPFAHEQLATAGRSFFAAENEAEDWVDVGKGGQQAFADFLKADLRQLEFGDDHLAERWRPTSSVKIDPTIQAGSPCIAGTRLPTSLFYELAEDGASVADLADDYEIGKAEVEAAIKFEKSLRLG